MTNPVPTASSAGRAVLRPAPARLLIVDDQPINIHAMHRILAGEKHELFMATSGEQALALCQSSPPDLVLLDALMPGMSGLELCAKLGADPLTADIPVIFVTALSALEDEARCWAAGCVDFITKPFHAQTVLHRVRTHLLFKQQAEQLRRLAWVDGLTGLPNRTQMEARMSEEFKRRPRSDRPLAVVALSIDHFRHFNETYGHLSGDQCLRQVSVVVQSSARYAHDLAARYDGKKFVYLLPETTLAGARRMAEQVVMAVRELRIPHEGVLANQVTVSAGYAASGQLPDLSSNGLLEQVDRALHRAKQAGRDQALGPDETPG